MAGAGGRSRERPTSRAEAAGGKQRRQRWEVDFATPRRAPSTPPPPGLRYISRGRHLHPGTWLPAASPADLSISRPTHSFDARVLTVSIGDVVYEEHYVSILNFSWPQVACVTECPVRGSRVVFMSFCDRSKQIQKFAVRFRHLSDAESFLNSVKGLSSNAMDIIPSGSDYMYECEDSSSSEYIASDGLQYRPDEAASFEEPTSDHRTDAPAVDYHKEPDQPVLQPPIATNINSIYSGFPDGYSGMLTDCSVKIEKDGEEFFPATTTDHAPEKAYMLDICHDGKGKEIDDSDETYDILVGIQQTNVANDSFHGRNHGNARGLGVGCQPVGHKAEASNYQQCHETKCVLPGCLIYTNVILQFRNVHGIAKVEHVPGCALNQLAVLRSGSGEYSGCRRCDRSSVINPCGAVSAGLSSQAAVSARRVSLLEETSGDHEHEHPPAPPASQGLLLLQSVRAFFSRQGSCRMTVSILRQAAKGRLLLLPSVLAYLWPEVLLQSCMEIPIYTRPTMRAFDRIFVSLRLVGNLVLQSVNTSKVKCLTSQFLSSP